MIQSDVPLGVRAPTLHAEARGLRTAVDQGRLPRRNGPCTYPVPRSPPLGTAPMISRLRIRRPDRKQRPKALKKELAEQFFLTCELAYGFALSRLR